MLPHRLHNPGRSADGLQLGGGIAAQQFAAVDPVADVGMQVAHPLRVGTICHNPFGVN